MIKPIVIKVTDKVPELVSGPEYVVCDNSDYTVIWQLDEEWAQFEHRTMQVNYQDGTYKRVLFTGDTCALPAIPVRGPVYVGLFAGDIHTTRPARLLAVRSATTDSGEERDPMPNGYAQAIKALDGKLDKNQGADNAGKALMVDEEGNVVPGEAQGSSLPAMSSDTAGKMLTNDGENAEWSPETYTSVFYWDDGDSSNNLFGAFFSGASGCIVVGQGPSKLRVPINVVFGAQKYGKVDILAIDANGVMTTAIMGLTNETISTPVPVSGTFIFNITEDSDGQFIADATRNEILANFARGRQVLAFDNSTGTFVPMVNYAQCAFKGLLYAPENVVIQINILINADNTVTRELTYMIPIYLPQPPLTDDQQAQARANIGLTPVAKTDAMTQSVGLDAETGELYTAPAVGDNTLGITGARVGQIAKITAVDAEGKPTAWEAVDLPSGGGEDTWEKIADVALTNGTPLYELANFGVYRKVKIMLDRSSYVSGLSKNVWVQVFSSGDIWFYSCGYMTDQYGYKHWEFEAEVNNLMITSNKLVSNNREIGATVMSTGSKILGDITADELTMVLSFTDTSVIQEGDTVVVYGVRR